MVHMLALLDETHRSLEDIATREGQMPELVIEHRITVAGLDGGPYFEPED